MWAWMSVYRDSFKSCVWVSVLQRNSLREWRFALERAHAPNFHHMGWIAQQWPYAHGRGWPSSIIWMSQLSWSGVTCLEDSGKAIVPSDKFESRRDLLMTVSDGSHGDSLDALNCKMRKQVTRLFQRFPDIWAAAGGGIYSEERLPLLSPSWRCYHRPTQRDTSY